MDKRNLLLTFVLVFFFTQVFAGTSTWTGNSSSDWADGGNWTGGVPTGASDIVILPAGPTNTTITNVPTIIIKRLEVTGGNYSLSSPAAITMTCAAGGAGSELIISAGASLTTSSNISIITGNRPVDIFGSFTAEGLVTIGGTVTVAGTANFNNSLTYNGAATITVTGALSLAGTVNALSPVVVAGTGTTSIPAAGCTLNNTIAFETSLNVAGNLIVNSGFTASLNPAIGNSATITSAGTITGAGNVSHLTGVLTIDGLVTNGGNFTNGATLTGLGTVDVGGTITNTTTMFGFPGNPPGKILSGYTWSGASSNLWTLAANWHGGVVPVSTGDAVFYLTASQPELDAAAQMCRQLYIHADAELTITSAGQLTASGQTRIGQPNGLAIESGTTSTGSFIDNGTISYSGGGSVKVLRYLDPDKWHGYCIPLTQVTTAPFLDYYMKYYDEQTNHNYKYVINPALDSTLNSDGLGYMMWSSSSTTNTTPVSVSGELNTGTILVNATRTQGYIPWTTPPGIDYDGWNLVGNPYVSAIDLDLLTYTNVGTAIWFWDPGYGNYTVYPAGGGVYGTHGSDIAAASQGFFVKATGAGGSVEFTNAARVHNAEPFLKEGGTDYLKVKVITAVNSFADEASLHFTEDASAGYDPDFDAEKLPGEATAPQLYFPVSNEQPLTINMLPWADGNMTIPVNFTLSQAGSCELSFDGLASFRAGTQIYLEDRTTGYTQDLSSNGKYQFSSSPSDDPARFLLHFTKSTIGFGEPGASQFTVYSYGNEIFVSAKSGSSPGPGTVEVIDLLGRVVFRAPLDNATLSTFEVNLQSGYYVVIVKTSGTVANKKIYLQ